MKISTIDANDKKIVDAKVFRADFERAFSFTARDGSRVGRSVSAAGGRSVAAESCRRSVVKEPESLAVIAAQGSVRRVVTGRS